jgi:FkbM family methyltransferase
MLKPMVPQQHEQRPSAISRYSTYLAWLAQSGYSHDLGWYIRRGGVHIPLENIDDFLTTYDVYASHHYDRLNQSTQPGSIVWDIGANIGVASLIFAQNPNVSHVYAYEPMPHTFACTQRTLRANPALASRITVENLGVGASNSDMEVLYTTKAKAAIGVADIPPRLKALYRIKPEDMQPVTIRIADADDVLRRIRAAHPGAPVLLKLDAEGAEYGIIDRLAETGTLRDIAGATIEWHLAPGEEAIASRLRAAGFHIQSKVLEPGCMGIVDAWR